MVLTCLAIEHGLVRFQTVPSAVIGWANTIGSPAEIVLFFNVLYGLSAFHTGALAIGRVYQEAADALRGDED